MGVTAKLEVPPPGEKWPHTWLVAGDLVISLTQDGDVPEDTWTRYLDACSAPGVRAVLGCAIGSPGVNAVQRRKSVDALKQKKVAGVTDSAIARGVITAVGWLGMNIKGFSWKDIESALDYLNSESVSSAEALKLTDQLLRSSGLPPLEEMLGGC